MYIRKTLLIKLGWTEETLANLEKQGLLTLLTINNIELYAISGLLETLNQALLTANEALNLKEDKPKTIEVVTIKEPEPEKPVEAISAPVNNNAYTHYLSINRKGVMAEYKGNKTYPFIKGELCQVCMYYADIKEEKVGKIAVVLEKEDGNRYVLALPAYFPITVPLLKCLVGVAIGGQIEIAAEATRVSVADETTNEWAAIKRREYSNLVEVKDLAKRINTKLKVSYQHRELHDPSIERNWVSNIEL
jgi:hypothetical protein